MGIIRGNTVAYYNQGRTDECILVYTDFEGFHILRYLCLLDVVRAKLLLLVIFVVSI